MIFDHKCSCDCLEKYKKELIEKLEHFIKILDDPFGYHELRDGYQHIIEIIKGDMK